jgi:hypothetical protein
MAVLSGKRDMRTTQSVYMRTDNGGLIYLGQALGVTDLGPSPPDPAPTVHSIDLDVLCNPRGRYFDLRMELLHELLMCEENHRITAAGQFARPKPQKTAKKQLPGVRGRWGRVK